MTESQIQLTQDQQFALDKIKAFVESDNQVFVLHGYAGTGKTTILKLITEQLRAGGRQVVLMAPTGRAAKILRDKTGMDASTLHSGIYNYEDLKEVKVADEEVGDSFRYFFDLKVNDNFYNRVYIVDESSMVSDDFSEGEFFRFGSGKLLSDLIQFTQVQHPDATNKLIFVGDPAQLPPPTSNKSPALSPSDLLENFGLKVDTAKLTTIIRQEEGSGILSATDQIRKSIDSGFFNQFLIPTNTMDIESLNHELFIKRYDEAMGKKIVITYTNQTAYEINKEIRSHKYGGEYPVRVGDIMLVGQNNHITGLYNGEFGVINRCEERMESREVTFKVAGNKTERILLKWRKIELAYQNEHGFNSISETYMLENFLHNKINNLKSEEQQALYVDFKNRHRHLTPGSGTFKDTIRKDPFFNALRLKYGFAVTCHKAQGGEWDNAFVFWDYGRSATFNIWEGKQEKTGRNNADFFRWSYTAITRASKALFCINPPKFTAYHNLSFVNAAAMQGMQHLSGETPNVCTFEVDTLMVEMMDHLGLPSGHVAFRNHFLSVYYQCKEVQIEVTKWKQSGYEFSYLFKQGDKTASVKGWIKGNNSFSTTYQKNPSDTNSEELYAIVHQICQKHAQFQSQFPKDEIKSMNHATLDWSVADQKPFLFQLYVDIQELLLPHQIAISQVEHLQYKERYTFEQQGEKAILDIEYDGQGFLGRVLPLIKPVPSASLLRDLETIFLSLKNQ